MQEYKPNKHISLDANSLLTILNKECIGKRNSRTVYRLSTDVFTFRENILADVYERKIRSLKNELEDAGIPVCSSLSSGYYLPETAEEANEYLERQERFAKKILWRQSQKRKTLFNIFGNQLNMFDIFNSLDFSQENIFNCPPLCPKCGKIHKIGEKCDE